MRSVQQVEDDDAFCRLIYRFTVNKMILKYQSGRKHELTNIYDETSEREGMRYSKSKPDDFLRAKYEHMMSSSWTDDCCKDSKGWKRRGRRTTRAVLGLARPASDTRTCQDIATQMAGILALAQ